MKEFLIFDWIARCHPPCAVELSRWQLLKAAPLLAADATRLARWSFHVGSY
jgi:hypothetical protein